MKKCLLMFLLLAMLLCAACGRMPEAPTGPQDPPTRQTTPSDASQDATQESAPQEATQDPSTQPATQEPSTQPADQEPSSHPSTEATQGHSCVSQCPICGLCVNAGCAEEPCGEKCTGSHKEDPHVFTQGDYITTAPVSTGTGTLVFDIGKNLYVPGHLAHTGEAVAAAIEKVSGLDLDGTGHARQNFPDGKVHIRVSREYLYAGQDWYQGLATSELGSAQASAQQHVEIAPGDLFFSGNYAVVHELSHMLMYRQSEWCHSELLNEGFAEYTTYLALLELERTDPGTAYHLDTSAHPLYNMMLTEEEYGELFRHPLEYWFENRLECSNGNYNIGFRFMAYLRAISGDYSRWIPAFESTYPFAQNHGDSDLSPVAQQIQVLKAAYGADVLDNFYPWLKANRQLFDRSGYETVTTDLSGVSQINWYPVCNALDSTVLLERVKYRELYINLETAKLYLGEYKGMDISGVYLENPGGCTVVCYRADGSYEVPTNETRISLEGISYIKLVGEGKLTQLRIKGFA